MIRTKKRILAMLLAVVLCFSSLPFSVSADEISSEVPTESTVESQPEESQAEETKEPVPAENTITISDGSGDVPVLYAQDPFNTVKSEVEGGTNYMTSYGVTRQSIVQELESHEHDSFYLGTPYHYEILAVAEANTQCSLYQYTDLSDPVTESNFRAAILKETDLDGILQAPGYLTLSTCNNGGGDSRVLVVASLTGEVAQ